MRKNRIHETSLFVLLLLISFWGCQTRHERLHNQLFREIERNFDKNELLKFSATHQDSLYKILPKMEPGLERTLDRICNKSELVKYLDTIGGIEEVIVRYLAVAYYLHANGRSFQKDSLSPVFYSIDRMKYEDELGVILKKADSLNEVFKTNDTIEVLLISRSNQDGIKKIEKGLILGGQKFRKKPETYFPVKLVGVIVEKSFQELYLNRVDSSLLIFKIRLLAMSEPAILIENRKFVKGDTVDFHASYFEEFLDFYQGNPF